MAMNAPPQGRGGYQGTNVDTAGLITPPNPLEQGQEAVYRAMRMAGISPGSFAPAAAAIRKKAGALVNELVLNAVQTGNVDALAAPAQALGMLADLIKRGASGGAIFGGKGDALSSLAAIGERSNAGEGVSPGEALIGQLLGNPNNTEALFLQGKYGGLSSQAQGAMATALAGIMDDYQKTLEGGAASATNVSGLLRQLLGQPTGSGMLPPTGPGGASGPGGALGGGTGVPSTATPSTPSSLPNPAAGMLPNPAGAMGGYGQQMMSGALGGLAALGAPGAPPGFGASRPGGADIPGAGMPGQPQQMMAPGNSFQPMNPANYLPEPIATLLRIQQGLAR